MGQTALFSSYLFSSWIVHVSASLLFTAGMDTIGSLLDRKGFLITAEVRYQWKTFPPAFRCMPWQTQWKGFCEVLLKWDTCEKHFHLHFGGFSTQKWLPSHRLALLKEHYPSPFPPPPPSPPCHTCLPPPPPTPSCISWWHNVPAWSSTHLLQGFRDFTRWVLFSIVLNGLSAEICLGPVFGNTNSLSAAVQFFFFAWVNVLCIIYTTDCVTVPS